MSRRTEAGDASGCLGAGRGASHSGWTACGSDREDAAIIVAYLTRIVGRQQEGREEAVVQWMASSVADSLCAALDLSDADVAAEARNFARFMSDRLALRGEG